MRQVTRTLWLLYYGDRHPEYAFLREEDARRYMGLNGGGELYSHGCPLIEYVRDDGIWIEDVTPIDVEAEEVEDDKGDAT